MTFKAFKRRVQERFTGFTLQFDHNEAEFTAVVTHPSGRGEMLLKSSPYSEEVQCFLNGRSVGTLALVS